MSVPRRLLLALPILAAASAGVSAGAARAAEPSAPTRTIQSFYDTLLAAMKAAKQQSFDQRYAQLAPAITRAFDLALMARIAVGPGWAQMRPDQQQRLTDAFARYTISTYASRFDGYAGERFEVDPATVQNAAGVIVQTHLVKSDGGRIALNYLMRQVDGGAWQVIDVFLSGTVSELATRRSEFVAVLRRDGAEGLVGLLDQRVAALRTE